MINPKFNSLNFIMSYEDGTITQEELVNGCQELIDSGLAWALQGAYGRMADSLISSRLCHK